jgi:hypothetical protein
MEKTFRTNQSQDYSINFEEFSRGYLRYLYARSGDSRSTGMPGQDYLAWRYRTDALGFVICDGVGSSFCGDIAARYLGDRLLDDLLFDVGPELERAPNKSALAELATKYLNQWKDGGHSELQRVAWPDNLPPLQIQALQQLKEEHGSETVFVCGRLSLREDSNKLVLIWMGDTQVRLFDRQGGPIHVEGRWVNSDRWSTKRGVGKRGVQVYGWMGDLDQIGRIIAFSDGLSAIADHVHTLADYDLQAWVGKQLLDPSSDDISFIDIRLKDMGQGQGEAEGEGVVAPRDLSVSGDQLRWKGVQGERDYQVEEAPNGVFYQSQAYRVRETAWPLAQGNLPPQTAYRYYRVRVWTGERSGPWSPALCEAPPRPALPGGLEIQDVTDDPTTYTIAWRPVGDAQYYVLEENDGKVEREVYLGRECTYTIMGQRPGTYLYRVRACGPAGPSGWSQREEKEVAGPPANDSAPAKGGDPGPSEAQGTGISTAAVPPQVTGGEQGAVTLVPTAPVPYALLEKKTDSQPEIRIVSQTDVLSTGLMLERPVLSKMEPVVADRPYLVSWSRVKGADSYELQVAASDLLATNKLFDPAYTGSLTSYEASRPTPGKCCYRVRALSQGQPASDWSEVEAIEVKESLKPDVPALNPIRNLSGRDTYIVEWPPVPDAEWYKLEEARTTSSTVDLAFATFTVQLRGGRRTSDRITDTIVTIRDRQPGIYHYRVCAGNKHGQSRYSQPVATEVRQSLPPASRFALGTPTWAGEWNWQQKSPDLVSVQLSWWPVASADTYILLVRDIGRRQENPHSIHLFPPRRVIQAEISLAEGTYDCYVRAEGDRGSSDWSDRIRVKVLRREGRLQAQVFHMDDR